ncbi:MAG: GntG family PLP-dependent aldolase [Symbiobacteriia bacterium]
MERLIDLRSDTVTVPTGAMRQAMAEAEVGDDVYGEDPTVQRLEELAAEMLGKEAALFVPTGTMGNQVSVMTHTRRGEEVILEAESHIFYYEVAGMAALSGAQARTVPGRRGAMDPAAVEAAVRDDSNIHFPRTALVCLENTHNRAGGTVVPLANMAAVADVAHRHGAQVHLDGARIFNAATALGVPVSQVAAPADSVMFCLSKGLAAPVGSLVAGGHDWIGRARKNRKLLGGGMRQVGVLAAAGLVSLTEMVARLPEDHANARRLGEGIANIPGLAIDMETVQTNMVAFDITKPGLDAPALVQRLEEAGVRTGASGPRRVRLVTHKDVSREDVEQTLRTLQRVLQA